jgi:hypothetical protein
MFLFLLVFFFFFFLRPGSRFHYIAQARLKLVVLLPQPPKCWDYSIVSPILFYFLSAVGQS